MTADVPAVDRADLVLERKLGQGGQGSVHAVSNRRISVPGTSAAEDGRPSGEYWDAVYKEYNAAVLPDIDIDALSALVALPSHLPGSDARWLCEHLAWPAALVTDSDAPSGFLMRAVPERFQFTLTSLSGTIPATKRLANVEYLLNTDTYVGSIGLRISDEDRLRILLDLARTLTKLHQLGIAVGDLSPKNLLFCTTPKVECFLIDCDAMRLDGMSVLPQVETPDWQLPDGEEKATAAGDAYKFALLAVRMFARDQTSTDAAALSRIDAHLASLASAGLGQDPTMRPAPALWTEQLTGALASLARTQSTPVFAGTFVAPNNVGGGGRRLTRAAVLAMAGSALAIGGMMTALAVATSAHGSPDPAPYSSSADPADSGSDGPPAPDTTDYSSVPAPPPTSAPPSSYGSVQFDTGAVGDPRATAVGELFDSYFGGINTGNYQQSLSDLDPNGSFNPNDPNQAKQFESGVASSYDSEITLDSIGPADQTSPASTAVVTFQSSQNAGMGPADDPSETCTTWSLTYRLTAEPDGSYLIYKVQQASDEAC